MQKAHSNINWVNYPEIDTPINEQNLNKMDVSIDTIDDRVIYLDTSKFDKSEAEKLVKSIAFERKTGIFTITYYSGATFTIDTLLEKLAVNFDYDYVTQQLIITLDDGEIKYIDLSALITQFEFLDTDTIAFSVDGEGKVSAIVKEGSIEEKHLRPDYLAEIKVESAKAERSAQNAAISETNAANSATASAKSESASKESETNAKTSETNASTSATNAASSANSASNSASAAENSAGNASTSANNAKTSESNAKTSESNAKTSETNASTSATNAASSASVSKSYAVGGTGTRTGEDTDNSKYYYEQALRIAQGLEGSLLPNGTITFAQLATATKSPGFMYNISDAFTSDSRFKDGGNHYYGAGSNVYYTVDGMWDVLAAITVTGVKGSAESTYRQGNVEITKENIGLGNVENKSSATIRGEITSANITNALGYKPPEKDTTYSQAPDKDGSTDLGLISGDDRYRLLHELLPIVNISNNLSTVAGGYALDARQGKVLNENINSLAESLNWKNLSTFYTGAVTADISKIDFREIIIKVNITSNIILTINIPKEFLSATAQNFRSGYYQNGTNGGMSSFSCTLSQISLTNAYLNAASVTASTQWVVYYR